ncbi:MAG: CAP domain-containing protein [Patescibacteria group bacterium]
MAKILSFGEKNSKVSKGNIFKAVWNGFNSLDRFIKFYIFYGLLVITVTPAIISGYLIFNPRADIGNPGIVALINQYRAQYGIAPLTEDQKLTNEACWFANDMAAKNYFSHTDSLGRSYPQRLAAFGIVGTSWYSENLGAGYTTAQELFEGWRTSTAGHNEIMLESRNKRIGIGLAYSAAGDFRWYWVADFASDYSGQENLTSNCVSNQQLPAATGTIQGYKVPNEGSIIPNQTVSLDGGSPPPASNPYFLTVSAGVNHTVSVSVPSGYNVGYTLCYNRIDCHNDTPTPGNSVIVNIPTSGSCGGAGPCADLWWHYTPTTSGTPLPPTNLKAVCNSTNTQGIFSWTGSSGAIDYSFHYAGPDGSFGWSPASNPTTINVRAGYNYTWKVKACSSSGPECSVYVTGPTLTCGTLDPNADADKDGFKNGIESFIGTDPLEKCLRTKTPGIPSSAWPPDLTGDNLVNGADTLTFNTRIGATPGTANYNKRWNLNGDGIINGADVLKLNNYFGKTCL